MRFFILTFIHLIVYFQLFSQEEDQPKTVYFPEYPARENVAAVVEKDAEFPGGTAVMMRYLANHLNLPDYSMYDGYECIIGRIIVRFIVEEDGSVTSIQFKKYNPNCTELYEAVTKMLLSMPKWVPAVHEGNPTASYYYLPMSIKWS